MCRVCHGCLWDFDYMTAPYPGVLGAFLLTFDAGEAMCDVRVTGEVCVDLTAIA
jgi:hypothetical protein